MDEGDDSGHGANALQAELSGPKGIAISPGGAVFLADTESHTIRVIRAKPGIIETVIGNGQRGDGPDGDPLNCKMDRPHGVFVDPAGNVYVGDSNNQKVRKLVGPRVKRQLQVWSVGRGTGLCDALPRMTLAHVR